MNAHTRYKVFRQWNRSPERAYARYGIGKVIIALNGLCLWLHPDNGFRYWTCLDGKIHKVLDEYN